METPSPSVIPHLMRDPSSDSATDSGQELSVPTKAREVVKYILDLPDNLVTSRNIMGETITARNLTKNLLFLDEYFIDLSGVDVSGNTEGLKLPQSNDCSKGTDEGIVCWDRDDNVLSIGNGGNVSQFYGFGPAIDSSEITNGTVSFDDLANSSTLDATTTWALSTNNLIINLDSTGDFILQDNGTAFATFADDGSTTFANDIAVNGGDITTTATTWNFDVGGGGTIRFRDGTNTLASIVDQGAYGTLRLTDKGSTGDPSTCTAGDIYFNATDATVKACTASNTWEGLDGGGLGYTLQIITGTSVNPSDSTTYYLGNATGIGSDTSASNARARFYIPKAGTVTAVYGAATATGILGSSETSTLAVRLNDTTSTTVTSSLAMSSASNAFNATGLSIAVVAGDYISITVATPAWVTNPTTVSISLGIYIE